MNVFYYFSDIVTTQRACQFLNVNIESILKYLCPYFNTISVLFFQRWKNIKMSSIFQCFFDVKKVEKCENTLKRLFFNTFWTLIKCWNLTSNNIEMLMFIWGKNHLKTSKTYRSVEKTSQNQHQNCISSLFSMVFWRQMCQLLSVF